MIHTIELNNFKCFAKQSFRIAPLTVFAGANGAGKSSVLQSLLMLRQSFVPEAPSQVNEIVLGGKLVNLISSEKVINKSSEDSGISVVIDDRSINEDFIVTIPDAGTASTNPACVYSDNKDEAFSTLSLYSRDFVYLYANRLTPEAEYRRASSRGYTDSRLGDRSGSDTAFCLQQAFDNNSPLKLDKLDLSGNGDVVSNVNLWLSNIIGSRMKVKPEAVSENNIKLIFTSNGGEEIDATNMAFGDTYILPIVLGVLTAEPGSLMIIENPEAHLHPGAQRRMGTFLALAAECGVQIVIETHSDHLLNGIRLAAKKGDMDADKVVVHFIYLDETGGHCASEISINRYGNLESWPEGFFDEWEKGLRDIID